MQEREGGGGSGNFLQKKGGLTGNNKQNLLKKGGTDPLDPPLGSAPGIEVCQDIRERMFLLIKTRTSDHIILSCHTWAHHTNFSENSPSRTCMYIRESPIAIIHCHLTVILLLPPLPPSSFHHTESQSGQVLLYYMIWLNQNVKKF